MGSNQFTFKSESKGSLICEKCFTHYLVEIITSEENISIRTYCYCGKFTMPIDQVINSHLYNSYDLYNNYRCGCVPLIMGRDNSYKKAENYCFGCKEFFCIDCSKKHDGHKNISISSIFKNKCKFHLNEKIIGFCKKCKIPICKECINDIHKGHYINYTENLRISEDEENIFKKNLLKACQDFEKLMKLKYGKETKVYMNNLSKPQTVTFFDNIDKSIVRALETLRTIYDSYNYHKNNSNLYYQVKKNLLKNAKVQIIRLPDKIDIKKIKDDRFSSITNTVFDNPDIPNPNVRISLKIDLCDEEPNTNEISIEFKKKLTAINFLGKKLIQLKNGNLAALCENFKKIIFFKDLKKEDLYLEANENINDFIELENRNIVILMFHSLIIYSFENNNYHKVKEISLDIDRSYFSLKNISNNNFSLISYLASSTYDKLYIFNYPTYEKEEIRLSDLNYTDGNLIDSICVGNLIIICCIKNDGIILFLYNLEEKNFEIKKIQMKFSFNYRNCHAFKINDEEILISEKNIGYVINIKTKQLVNLNQNFGGITKIAKIGKYMLVAFYNFYKQNISQINFIQGKIFNIYSFPFNTSKDITAIIDLGNNHFCFMIKENDIYLFEYK